MKKFYIETYGCQMNVADSEVVTSILVDSGFESTCNYAEADVIFLNTCSIREKAEQKVLNRLDFFGQLKNKSGRIKIGVLGCMAERLQEKLLEKKKAVDYVIGPDNYRSLPEILKNPEIHEKSVSIMLSKDETYEEIIPFRYNSNGVSAFVSIMRGCENMCTYCIVPYVRGTERSRNPDSIINEINNLVSAGFKEITLIGQNVNSYCFNKEKKYGFPRLLENVARNFPGTRIRFSTNHPKDLSEELLQIVNKYGNICKNIHLPVQSGSTKVLESMNRGYTREHYLNLIDSIRKFIPGCSVSTDIMVGFCGETNEDFEQTLLLMNVARFDFAFMFKYSPRPGTFAAGNMKDDVAEQVKIQRLNEVIKLQGKISSELMKSETGKVYQVLAEGFSKKSDNEMSGRTSHNKVVVFPSHSIKSGDFVNVKITKYTSATLIGEII